jgi:hypothetical protein
MARLTGLVCCAFFSDELVLMETELAMSAATLPFDAVRGALGAAHAEYELVPPH